MKTMDGDTDDISIEGGKAEQKTQHQQNIEKLHLVHIAGSYKWPCYTWNHDHS